MSAELRKLMVLASMLSELAPIAARILEPALQGLRGSLEALMSLIEGSRTGRDIASFYRELASSGMPRELVEALTVEYARRRMGVVPSISDLLRALEGLATLKASRGASSSQRG